MPIQDLLLYLFVLGTPLCYLVYFLLGSGRIKWNTVFAASLVIGLVCLFVTVSLSKPLEPRPLALDATAEQRAIRIILEERVRTANAVGKPIAFTLSVFACLVWNLVCYWLCFAIARFALRLKQIPQQTGPILATKVLSLVAFCTLPLTFFVAEVARTLADLERQSPSIANLPGADESQEGDVGDASSNSDQTDAQSSEPSAVADLPAAIETVSEVPLTSGDTSTATEPKSANVRAISPIAKLFAVRTQGLADNAFNNDRARHALHLFLSEASGPGGVGKIVREKSRGYQEGVSGYHGWTQGHPVHCELTSNSCAYLVYIPDYAGFTTELKQRIKQGFWDAAHESALPTMPPGTDIAVAIFNNEGGELVTNEIVLGKFNPPVSPAQPRIVGVGLDEPSAMEVSQVTRPGTVEELLYYFSPSISVPDAELAIELVVPNLELPSNNVVVNARSLLTSNPPSKAVIDLVGAFSSNTQNFSRDSFNNVFAKGALDAFLGITNSADGAGELIMKASDRFREIPKPERSRYDVFAAWNENAVHCELSSNSCAFLIHIPYYHKFTPFARNEISRKLWLAANEAVWIGLPAGGEMSAGSDIAVAVFHNEVDQMNTTEVMLGSLTPPRMRHSLARRTLSFGAERRGRAEDLLSYFQLSPTPDQEAVPSPPQRAPRELPKRPELPLLPQQANTPPELKAPEALSQANTPQAKLSQAAREQSKSPRKKVPDASQSTSEPEITQIFRKFNQLASNSSNNPAAAIILESFENKINIPDGPVERVVQEYFQYRSNHPDTAGKFPSWKQRHAIHCQLNQDSCAFLIDIPLFGAFYPESQAKLRHEFWHASNESLQHKLPIGSKLAIAIFQTENDQVVTKDIMIGAVSLPFESNTDEPETSARRYRSFAPKGANTGSSEELLKFFK